MSKGTYTFHFEQPHEDLRQTPEEYFSPDLIYPSQQTTIVVEEEDGSLMSLVAAFRALLRSSGYTDKQARQVVILKHSEVKE